MSTEKHVHECPHGQLLAQSCRVSGLFLTEVEGSLGALPPQVRHVITPAHFIRPAFNFPKLSVPHTWNPVIFIWGSYILWNWQPGPSSSSPGWVPNILLNLYQSHGTRIFFQVVNEGI